MSRSKKSSKEKSAVTDTAQLRLLDGLHQIWLAGLGAVSRAQRGTPKLVEELVAEGARVHAKARGTAEKAVRGALEEVQSTVSERINNVRGQAAESYDNLEKIFQTRVRRALNQLGVPSADDVTALSKRVEKLNASIEKLGKSRRSTPRARAAATRKEEKSASIATS